MTYSRLNAFVAAGRERGWQPSTVWYSLAILRRAYTLAVREGLLSAHPAFPTVHVSNARQGFFERADFNKVCAELPDYLRAVATFAYLTGWRVRSEVLPLRWSNVDFVNGVVRLDVRSTKNDAGRTFPFAVLPELGDLLRRQRLAADAHTLLTGQACPFVFALDGKAVRDPSKGWRAACTRAGLSGMILHDFRRTAIRNLTRAGVAEHVAMKLSGHKTASVFRRYSIVAEPDLVEAVAKLAAHQEREAHASQR